MRDAKYIFTRREFMQGTLIATLGASLPAFLTDTVSASAARGVIPGFKDDRILVVVQLGGGNDGLNTIVPHGNDDYFKARKNIALDKKTLLRIDDNVAMNGEMSALKDLYDSGGLGIVNGVGYPNPNRSHFRSMEIWQTAVDSNRYSREGWVGRYFDNCCSGSDPVAGVNVGSELPQAFLGKKGVGVSFTEASRFAWFDGNKGALRPSLDTINMVSHKHDSEGETIDFLRHTAANAVISSDRVIKAAATKRDPVTYPGGRLGTQLKSIATLIAGGLPTRIYYTSISGFDTHANQLNGHGRLLGEFSGALTAFLADLKKIGAEDRVMVVAFSEFGRRVTENASRGTDHGTAGPMFLAGAGIKPGVHGAYPSLTDLDEGDLKHTVDFRGVYSEVLSKWFATDPALALGKKFDFPGVISL